MSINGTKPVYLNAGSRLKIANDSFIVVVVLAS